jgi:hypothetical protein
VPCWIPSLHFVGFETTPWGFMGKREPQIILKTDERNAVLELGRDGKFAAKSNGWDENRVFLEGDSFRTGSRTRAPVLNHLPMGPWPAVEPVRHYFNTE